MGTNSSQETALSVQDVAARLRVSEDTILRELHSGKLVGFRVRRQWRIWPADLADYERRRDEPAPKPRRRTQLAHAPLPTRRRDPGSFDAWKRA